MLNIERKHNMQLSNDMQSKLCYRCFIIVVRAQI